MTYAKVGPILDGAVSEALALGGSVCAQVQVNSGPGIVTIVEAALASNQSGTPLAWAELARFTGSGIFTLPTLATFTRFRASGGTLTSAQIKGYEDERRIPQTVPHTIADIEASVSPLLAPITANAAKLGTAAPIRVVDYGVLAANSAAQNTAGILALVAAVNQIANTDGAPIQIELPRGVLNWGEEAWFTRPVEIVGNATTVNDVCPAGKFAFRIGPEGIVVNTADTAYLNQRQYGFSDVQFTGGLTSDGAVRLAYGVTAPRFSGVKWVQYGRATGTIGGAAPGFQSRPPGNYGVFGEAHNWDVEMVSCQWLFTINGARTQGGNFVRLNGKSAAGVSDQGQSRLRWLGGHISNNPQSNTSNTMLYVSGFGSEVAHAKIEGAGRLIQIGGTASNSRVVDCYFETPYVASGPVTSAIFFGESDTADFTLGLEVRDCVTSTHNLDFGVDGYLLAPAGPNSGLQNAKIINNKVSANGVTRPLVWLNDVPSQTGNYGAGNTRSENGAPVLLHRIGAAISDWRGPQGVVDYHAIPRDAAHYLQYQLGTAAAQYLGVQLLSHTGTLLGEFFVQANGILGMKAANGKKVLYDGYRFEFEGAEFVMQTTGGGRVKYTVNGGTLALEGAVLP